MKLFSHVWLFATSWTAAYQAPPSMRFSRPEYWSGLPFPSPGDPTWVSYILGRCFNLWATREAHIYNRYLLKIYTIWNNGENHILCLDSGYYHRSECWQRIGKDQGLSTGSHQHPTPWRKEEGSTKRTNGLINEVEGKLKEYEVLEVKWRMCLQEEGMIN